MLKNKFIFTLQRFANITNETSNTLVSGTSYDDSISNYATDVTISGGGGYDTVYNSEDASNSSISGDEGNDSIKNYASQVTIEGGAGNDSIVNQDSENVLFKYSSGDGNDTIKGFNPTSTLKIGDGTGTYSTQTSGNDVLINVGKGVIKLENVYATTNRIHINNDTIDFELKTVNLNDGNDSISNYDTLVKINGGSGNDSIYNYAKYVVINGNAGADSISNYGNNVTIDGGNNNDTISNTYLYSNRTSYYPNNVLINGGAGNDSIKSTGWNVTIDGGDGDDTINGGDVVYGGEGNDSIINGDVVYGGKGDDTISDGDVVYGGEGNDHISLGSYSKNNLIAYTAGDGNDLIEGFNDTSTLSISGGSYSTQISGLDVLVNVGDSVIKLAKVYSTANMLHINDETIEVEPIITLNNVGDSISNRRDNLSIIGSSGDDTIDNSGSNVSITGGVGNDSIYNDYSSNIYNSYGSNVSIDGGEGNDSISGGHVVYGGKGNDYISSGHVYGNGSVNESEEVDYRTSSGHVVYGEAGDDTITNLGSNSTIIGGAGNDSIINQAKSGTIYVEPEPDADEIDEGFYASYYYGADSVSIDSGDGDDFIRNEAKEVTINAGAGADTIYNGGAGGNKTSIDGGADNDSITNYRSQVTIDGADGNDTISNSGAKVSINGGAGNNSICNYGKSTTIDAGDGDDTIDNDGTKVTITGGAGNDEIENSGSNVTIDGAEDNDFIYNSGNSVTITGSTGNDTIRLTNSGSGKLIYSECDGEDVIQSYNSSYTLQIGDGTGTCSMQTSGNDVLINVGDGVIKLENVYATATRIKINKETISLDEYKTFNLTEGDDYIANYRDSATIIGNAGNDSIYNSGSNVLFQYTEGDGNDSIVGFNKTSTLQIGGGNDTYSKETVDSDIIVTVGDGKITLQGAATLSKVNIEGIDKTVEENSWTLNNSTATYGTSNETLITIKGVKSLKGISLSGTTVTVAKSSLNAEKVTISDGYSLKLADDVTKPTTKKAWSLKSSTATYKQTTTAGYSLANNEINYTKKATTTLATVKGVKSIDGLKVSGTTITVSKASLNAKNVTVSDGYTLKLGSNVTKPTVKNAAWSLKSTTATYKGTSTAGYTLASDSKSITYSKKATTTLATVKGVKSIKGLKVNDKVITVSKASLGTSKITLSGDGYTLKLGSDVSKSTTKNAWSYSNSTATYKQTSSAGYSLATNSKSITYSKTSATNTLATVKGAKSKSGLSVSDNVIILKNSALSNKVTVSGSYEFDFASDYKKATITGSSSSDTITARGSNIKLNGGAGADSLSGGSSNDSINGGAGNDVIYGNKGKDTLVGGNGNDSLWGGAGNDSLYGGAGNDTFIYKPGEGTDTIFDYQSGDLLTILKSDGKAGGTFTSSSFKNSNLTLSIDGGGSVIFNGVSKSNSFNINGDSYKISGSKLVQK